MNATIDPRAVMAARNNADWYAMMGDIHGVDYTHDSQCFVFRGRPPPYHSGATIIDPAAPPSVMAHRPTGSGVKDGFARFDLSSLGLKPAIHAEWFYADAPPPADATGWEQIITADALALWEAAWKAGGSPSDQIQFPPAILSRADVTIWGRRKGDDYDAGGIANLSRDCVGLSNTFGHGALAAVAAKAARTNLPFVGYDWGDDLTAAQAAGFTPTGPLTIWFAN